MTWSVVTPPHSSYSRLPACSVGSQSRACFNARQVEGSSLLLILSVFFFLFFRETGINAPRQTALDFEAACAAHTVRRAVACLAVQAAVKPLNVLIKGSGLKGGGVAALPSLPPSSCDEEELNTNQMQRLKGMYISSPHAFKCLRNSLGSTPKVLLLQFCSIFHSKYTVI